MLNRLRTTLLICAIVFGILDLITHLKLLPFMALSLGASIFLLGLNDLKNKKPNMGYVFITVSLFLILVAVIKLLK